MWKLTKPVLLLGAVAVAGLPCQVAAGPEVQVDAYGNNPDWQLQIMEDSNRIKLNIEGQSNTFRYAALGPSFNSAKKTWMFRVVNDHHSISIFVKGKACQDNVTGKNHEVTVIVSMDGKGYGGCGDVLTHLLEP